jgi:hypothetical protein
MLEGYHKAKQLQSKFACRTAKYELLLSEVERNDTPEICGCERHHIEKKSNIGMTLSIDI